MGQMIERIPPSPSISEAEACLDAYFDAGTPLLREEAMAQLRDSEFFRGKPVEASRLLRDRIVAAEPAGLSRELWFFAADVYLQAGAPEACRFALERGFAAPDRRPGSEADGFYTLGWLEAACARWPEAAAAWERTMSIVSGDLKRELVVRRALGEAWEAVGQPDRASFELGEALKIAAQLGAVTEEVEILCLLGRQALDGDRMDDAARYYRIALERSREEGLRSGEMQGEIGYGAVCSALGELADAEAHFVLGLEAAREEPADALQQLAALSGLADVRAHRGDFSGAWSALEEAVFLAKGTEALPAVASLYHAMGALHEAAGKDALALAAYERALAERREAGDAAGLAITLNNLGALHHRNGEIELAKRHYREALVAFGSEEAQRPERRVILDNLRFLNENRPSASDAGASPSASASPSSVPRPTHP